jgi:hypothetical protein
MTRENKNLIVIEYRYVMTLDDEYYVNRKQMWYASIFRRYLIQDEQNSEPGPSHLWTADVMLPSFGNRFV